MEEDEITDEMVDGQLDGRLEINFDEFSVIITSINEYLMDPDDGQPECDY